MTTWFERQPGSEESLLALYDAVGFTEELDLAEQAHDEAFSAEMRTLNDRQSDEADAPADLFSDDKGDETERITMAQAVGLIEHLLGARPMADGGHSAL